MKVVMYEMVGIGVPAAARKAAPIYFEEGSAAAGQIGDGHV
jgi:hypothetical protein